MRDGAATGAMIVREKYDAFGSMKVVVVKEATDETKLVDVVVTKR